MSESVDTTKTQAVDAERIWDTHREIPAQWSPERETRARWCCNTAIYPQSVATRDESGAYSFEFVWHCPTCGKRST